MIFTEPVLYLAFTLIEIGNIFLDNLFFLFHLDNISEIYLQ